MTTLKKMLQEENVLDPKDRMFEDFCIKTISDPKLLPIQKAKQVRSALEIAETDYQKSVGQAYSNFCDAMVNGGNVDPAILEKAQIMLLSAEVLLRTAERKRQQK